MFAGDNFTGRGILAMLCVFWVCLSHYKLGTKPQQSFPQFFLVGIPFTRRNQAASGPLESSAFAQTPVMSNAKRHNLTSDEDGFILIGTSAKRDFDRLI